MIINASSLCEKLYVFGVFLWSVEKSDRLKLLSVILATIAITLTEVFQVFLEGCTAEITDPMLFVLTAWLLAKSKQTANPLQPEYKPRFMKKSPKSTEIAAIILLGPIVDQVIQESTLLRSKVLQIAVIILIAMSFTLYFLLHIPGVPYNVSELFLYNGSGPDLVIFSLAILVFGVGTAWMGKVAASTTRPFLHTPSAAITVSICFYLLVFLSVTEESIMDVAGSANIVWLIQDKGILGDFGVKFVDAIGADRLQKIADIFEPIVRFGTLWGTLIIFLGSIYASLFQLARASAMPLAAKIRFFLGRLFIHLLYMLPWLFLCKVITFDESSTDNLNELFAHDGEYGFGGGGYIYALIGLISLCAALLAWSIRGRNINIVSALVVSVLAIPIGWFLINVGLAENVGKYGLNYSGVDFLLGPDRTHKLAKVELFFRWSVVQFSTTIALATGASLYLKWDKKKQFYPSMHHHPTNIDNVQSHYDIRVKLDVEHIEMLNNIASKLDTSLSSIVSAIVDYIKQELDSSVKIRSLIFDEIKRKNHPISDELSTGSILLHLSNQTFKTIVGLQVETGIEKSYLLVKLIRLFFLASEVEAEKTREIG